ncbi:arf-GAP with Rho-GAP domain, ANK repeat and PH domain-containing protein 1 isoform X2 [Dunckerocampus dactyliophorus]|uniref:arf-GAP with Rho-GAP domain, ANK repeat and PH domain-containing protein 1 isoform X2 n=1 Tax=Dunckerocampus dactyliophorus TaxID=161453 RepID=UPI002407530C|nr:arf-GAP with Rho-GAP domain, ANK repeat and PH domain-containing protein 1 isoform X2 [Dunckerocampus dactyliophorus]
MALKEKCTFYGILPIIHNTYKAQKRERRVFMSHIRIVDSFNNKSLSPQICPLHQMTPPPPVPKPRARYARDSASSSDRDLIGPNTSNGVPLRTDGDASPVAPLAGSLGLQTLEGVAEMLSVDAVVAPASDSAPSPPAHVPAPSSPPSIHSMASSIASHIPSLAGAASVIANPAVATPKSSTTPTNVSSMMNIHSLASMLSNVANPDARSAPHLPAFRSITDVLVVDPSPPADGNAASAGQEEEEEGLYITVLESWDDDADSDSSNEEEHLESSSEANEQMRDDLAHSLLHGSNVAPGRSASVIPARPAPPPPLHAGQSAKTRKNSKQKTPSVATIRVSRKKGYGTHAVPQSAVVRASWLDTWKGFRHYVFWVTFDGQLMSLWKKRTDHFSEVLFHVSSITNVKKLDKRRFSVYFKKKHYDFMAHSDDVQDGWIQSLLASRGQASPAGPDLHGPITIKDPKSRFYAAVWGHDLWIYPNKDGFQLGVASYSIPLNLASVRATGKHSFTLTTPFRTINLSVDSSKDLSVWVEGLSSSICSALSCSQVATRLWKNPSNQQCADCSAADPEWASVNLLLVICHSCAGHHRALGSTLSKVRSLKMDNKVWTEPLIQLFVTYGNRLANQVWAPLVPPAEQIRPESSDEHRSKFIQDKYSRGRYRRVHALASSSGLMQQRLREVICGIDVQETVSLIFSGAKVCQTDPQHPSPIQLAERAGQALQAEILKLNEYTEVPPYLPKIRYRRADSAPSEEEEEELHGKLEEDRFLFSLENDSAACDVLDLRDVLSLFRKDGPTFQFELVTLDNQIICVAESEDELLTHLVHILKVILPGGVSYAEVCGALAVSKVCVVEVGAASDNPDAWLLLWDGGVSVHHTHRHSQQALMMELSTLSHHEMEPSEDVITMVAGDRHVSLHFDEDYSCRSWYRLLQDALANHKSSEHPAAHQCLYPLADLKVMGSVPLAVERCISHIQDYGLKVEGVYRRCGLASKVSQLVEALVKSPSSASLETDEQGVLDVAAALKQYIRQQEALFPERERKDWIRAAMISDERERFSAYRRLLRQLPVSKHVTVDTLFGHFYMVQTFSQVNKMSAHNLALVLVPSLFHSLNADLLKLTREFIIHHGMIFLTHEQHHADEEEEQITVF